MAKQGDNIYKRKDGRYEGRYIKGYKANRVPLYGYVYGLTYEECKKKQEPFKIKYQRPQNAAGFTGAFSDYAIIWLKTTVRKKAIKPSTYGSYYRDIYNHIIPGFGEKLPHMLSEADIEDFVDKLGEKGLSEGTIAKIMRRLSAIIGKAREAGIIVNDICKGIKTLRKKKKAITVLTRSAQQLLEQVCEQEKTGLLPILALYTGMRVGEISALKWIDVDLEEGLIYVRKTAQRLSNYDEYETKTAICFGSPKTETSERVIAIPRKLISDLIEHRKKAVCEYVISCKGHIAEPRVCQYRFESLLKKAGIERISFHSLRHTYATRCWEEGVDEKTLSDLMGHSSVEMTFKYGSALVEHKKKVVMLLDNVVQIVV